MKERTTPQRNILGAFLGGLLGILALGFLHPATLPIGCFLGVIVGWWYQEIWETIRGTIHEWADRGQAICKRIKVYTLTSPGIFKKRELDISPLIRKVQSLFFYIGWIIRSPAIFVRWLKSHPMNRAYSIRVLATITFVAISFIWLAPLFSFLQTELQAPEMVNSIMPLFYILAGILTPLLTVIMPPLFAYAMDDRDDEKMKRYYLHWEQYSKNGALKSYFYELKTLYSVCIKATLYFIVTLTYLVVIWSFVLSVVFLPISVFVGIVKGIYKVAHHTEHWLCLAATLLVTSLTAWYAHPHIASTQILWMVALINGLIAAVAAEGLRRALVWFYSASESVNHIVTGSVFYHLSAPGRYFVKIDDNVENFVRRLLPASI